LNCDDGKSNNKKRSTIPIDSTTLVLTPINSSGLWNTATNFSIANLTASPTNAPTFFSIWLNAEANSSVQVAVVYDFNGNGKQTRTESYPIVQIPALAAGSWTLYNQSILNSTGNWSPLQGGSVTVYIWQINYSRTTTSNPNSTTNAPIPSTNPKMVLKSDPNSSFVSTITVPYSTYVPPSTQNEIQNSSSGFPAWGIGLIVLAVVLLCCICMITLLVLTRKKSNQNQANQPILNAPPPPQQSSRQSWGSAMNNDQKRNQNNEQHEQSQEEKSHEEQSREVSEHEEYAEKE